MRVFHGLFLLSIFLLGFCPKISAQPPSIKIGIGYFKGIDKKAFYAPVIIQNTQYQSVAISEGEPIIEINGKNLKVYENLLDDETAFLRTRAEWHQVLSACEDCAFRTVDVSNLSKKSWIGYKNIFSFGEEFNRMYLPVKPELDGGFLGFTYKLSLKANSVSAYIPIVETVIKGSPAELSGIKQGDELTKIEITSGNTESFCNIPLDWIILKMQGDIGEKCTVYVNGNDKKVMERANLYGEPTHPQVVQNCVSGDCWNGKGILKNGQESYNGRFFEGKYDGKGKIYKNETLVFDGNFRKGKKNGSGIEYRLDGTLVETIYTNGKPGNSNKFTLPNGFAYYEVWQGSMKVYYDLGMNPMSEQAYLAGTNKKSTYASQSEPLYADNVTMTPKAMRGEPASPPKPATTTKPATNYTPNTTKTTPIATTPKTSAPPVTTPKPAEGLTCTYCKGSGLYASYEKCKASTCKNGYVNCATCKGTLQTANPKTGEKEFCTKGRKINNEMLHGHECGTCKGSGLVKGSPSSCIFCKGTGKTLK